MDTRCAVERAARDSYGRLLAYLSARSRDVAAAEDALADAFHAALASWPRTGVPAKPEAWLLTAARRRLIDGARHARVHTEAVPTLRALAEEAQARANGGLDFPDERLTLLFVCAHPAIDPGAHTPLMLQTALGLDAAPITSYLRHDPLVRPSTMGQRLTRAKRKIRNAGIRFAVPQADELPRRLEAVLQAVYAAYGSGWDDVDGADPRRRGLATEAIDLGRLLTRLMPDAAEAHGLLALMLHCEARRAARRTPQGDYVPLSEQDVACWSTAMIGEAERSLASAARIGPAGRFQLEAAIQSAHAQRARGRSADWEAIALLYEGLVSLAPTVGALVGRAAAVSEVHGASAGWASLDSLPGEALVGYQPYWALAGHLLARTGRWTDARAAYERAIGLCEEPAVRLFLARQASRLPER